MTFLSFYLTFGLLVVLLCGLGFKIQTLCLCVVNVLIKGEIEKPSGPWFDL
jgi:hypothetical protein